MNRQRPIARPVKAVGAAVLVAFISSVAILAIPGSGFLVLLLTLSIGTIILVALFIALWRRHWALIGYGVVSLFAIALLEVVPSPSESAATYSAWLVRVVLYRSDLKIMAKTIGEKRGLPPIAAVGIDGFGSMTDGIAVDPTGEILLQPSKRSEAWKEAAEYTDIGLPDLHARHIVGPYYRWTVP